MSTSNESQAPENTGHSPCIRSAQTLESFLWDESPSVNKSVVLGLAKLDFIKKPGRQNVVFSGPVACGKSHIANALSDLALQAGFTVNHVNGHRLDARFSWQATTERYLVDCDLLIVDEPLPTEHLRAILLSRADRATILVTDRPAAELIKALFPAGDSRFAALLDRWGGVNVDFPENAYGLKLRAQR